MAEQGDHGARRRIEVENELTRGLADTDAGVVPLERSGRGRGGSDVAGWEVIAADGTIIGAVERVVSDAAGRELAVELAPNLAPAARNRHVLIPESRTRRVHDRDALLVEGLRAEDVDNLPPYADEAVTREFEVELRDRVGNDIAVKPEPEQGFLGTPGKLDTEGDE